MIKHGQIYPVESLGPTAQKQLSAIRKSITKGVADAKESITLLAEPCDVKDAKPFDPQNCAAAYVIDRKLHPEAVSVGRSVAYMVFNGLAHRFVIHQPSRGFVDNFDKGIVFHRPITFSAPDESKVIGAKKQRTRNDTGAPKREIKSSKPRAIKLGVRALSGGIVVG